MDFAAFLKRHAVAVFASLSILLTFATYLLPLPREALPFLMVLVPAAIAIILAGLTEGMPGVRALLRKLAQWRVSIKWLALALLVPLAMRLVISAIGLLTGMIPTIQIRSMSVAEAILLAVIFIVAAIPEELGWRGYALPQLLKSHSPVSASLVIGVLWGVLHLALHLPGLPNAGMPGALTVAQLIGLSMLLTWLYIQGGNNILLTVIFHAAQSFFVILNDGITLSQQMWLMAVVWLAAALVVFAASRTMRTPAGLNPV